MAKKKNAGRKRIETYFASGAHFSFIAKRDQVKVVKATGLPSIVNGEKEVEVDMVNFTTVSAKPANAHCCFELFDDTAEHIAERIQEIADDDDRYDVYTADEWVKVQNPQQYSEMKRRKAVEREMGRELVEQKSRANKAELKLKEITSLAGKAKDESSTAKLLEALAKVEAQ